jgi:hypothetical protein
LSLTAATPANVDATAGAVGVGTLAARDDHRHAVNTGTPVSLTLAGTNNAGTAVTLARSDHVHNLPNVATPVSLTVGGANAAGSAVTLVRSDHTHGLPSFGSAANTFCQGNDARLSDDRTASGLRTATTVVAVSPAAAPSSGQVLTATSTTAATWQTLPAGLALASTTPANVAAAGAVGVGTTAARSDHVHAHGAQSDGTMHAVATTSVAGFQSAADKVKEDGIEAGAQVTSFARVQAALAVATSAVSFNSQAVTGILDPTNPQDAASKNYVDAVAAGLDLKASCRLVSTSNMASLGGVQVIDGVTTNTGDRLLIAGQTTASANGIYIGSGFTWLRAPDADTSAKVTSGMYTFITEGTVNADSGWALTTPDPITLGTTALTFTQVTGTGQITAGAGLTKSGNVLNVVANADGSMIVNPDDIKVGVLATDAQHGTRGGGTLHAVVVAAGAAGFMSGTDKTKLDGISTGAAALASTAPANVGITAAVGVGTTAARSDHVHAHGAQTDGTLHAAVVAAGASGFMTGADKTKLDGISTGAAALTSTVPVNADAAAAAVGVATTAARGDHKHQVTVASPSPLAIGSAGADGTSTSLARADHVHTMPIFGGVPATLTVSGAAATGSSTSLPRNDHVHAMPGLATTSTDGFMSAGDKLALTSASAVRTRSYFDVRLATANVLPAYTATTISTNRPRLTATANGALSIDGVAVAVNDLVLVLFEAVANCGVYQVIAAGGVSTPYQLDLAYSGAYTALVNNSQMVVRTTDAGFAYCNREFRPGSVTSGLFVEIPGAMQIFPRDQTPPTTIYPGWQYELDLIAGTSPSLTLVSPVGSEQVLRGVQFGVTVGAEGLNSVTITPTVPSHIQGPYSQVDNGDPSATFPLDNGGTATWVCGRGYTSYSPDSPSWRMLSGAGLLATGLASAGNSRVTYISGQLGIGDVLTLITSTQAGFYAPPVDPGTNGYRLSPTTDDSIPSDGTFSTVYLAAVNGAFMALYDPLASRWYFRAPTSQPSYALATRTAGLPFDVYAAWNGTTIILEVVNWASANARVTPLSQTTGVWVKPGDPTRRYLGTVRPRSATTYQIRRSSVMTTAPAGIDIWNVSNRIQANVTLLSGSSDWSYSTGTYRQANGSANAQIDTIAGLATDAIALTLLGIVSSTGTSATDKATVAISTPLTGLQTGARANVTVNTTVGTVQVTAYLNDTAPLGVGAYKWLEKGTSTATNTWYADAVTENQSALTGIVWG